MIESINEATNTRRPRHSFQKGNTHGKGRPEGSRNKTTLAIDRIGEENAEEIITKLIELARSGDMAALKICSDRLWPIKRGTFLSTPLPECESLEGAVEALKSSLNAFFRGELTDVEVTAVASTVGNYRKTIELADFEVYLNKVAEHVGYKK